MNCPLSPRASQARRMGFQIEGASCHSSIKRGGAPSRIDAGSMPESKAAPARSSR